MHVSEILLKRSQFIIFPYFLFSGGILLTRVTVFYGLGLYILTYCIIFGIGMGLPYSVIFSIASSASLSNNLL